MLQIKTHHKVTDVDTSLCCSTLSRTKYINICIPITNPCHVTNTYPTTPQDDVTQAQIANGQNNNKDVYLRDGVNTGTQSYQEPNRVGVN